MKISIYKRPQLQLQPYLICLSLLFAQASFACPLEQKEESAPILEENFQLPLAPPVLVRQYNLDRLRMGYHELKQNPQMNSALLDRRYRIRSIPGQDDVEVIEIERVMLERREGEVKKVHYHVNNKGEIKEYYAESIPVELFEKNPELSD